MPVHYGKILLDNKVGTPERDVVNMRIDKVTKELYAKFSDGVEKLMTGAGAGTAPFILKSGLINTEALDGSGNIRAVTAYLTSIGFNGKTPNKADYVFMKNLEIDSLIHGIADLLIQGDGFVEIQGGGVSDNSLSWLRAAAAFNQIGFGAANFTSYAAARIYTAFAGNPIFDVIVDGTTINSPGSSKYIYLRAGSIVNIQGGSVSNYSKSFIEAGLTSSYIGFGAGVGNTGWAATAEANDYYISKLDNGVSSKILEITDAGNKLRTQAGDTVVYNDNVDGLLKYDKTALDTASVDENTIMNKGYIDASQPIKQISFANSPYSAAWDEDLEVDCTGGDVVINFPTAIGSNGRSLLVGKVDGTVNKVTYNSNGAEPILTNLAHEIIDQYTSIKFKSNGTGISLR